MQRTKKSDKLHLAQEKRFLFFSKRTLLICRLTSDVKISLFVLKVLKQIKDNKNFQTERSYGRRLLIPKNKANPYILTTSANFIYIRKNMLRLNDDTRNSMFVAKNNKITRCTYITFTFTSESIFTIHYLQNPKLFNQ